MHRLSLCLIALLCGAAPYTYGFKSGLGHSISSRSRTTHLHVFGRAKVTATAITAAPKAVGGLFDGLCGAACIAPKALGGLFEGLCGAACIAPTQNQILAVVAVVLAAALLYLQRTLWAPSRPYNREKNTVGVEYDSWTTEGILEYYWGEHIHLGYYNDEERAEGYKKKNFIGAKYDFIDQMAVFGKVNEEALSGKALKILDVGCGIGGTSRFLAKKYKETGAAVTGITLSPQQVKRAKELAARDSINNVDFQVMDALNMSFPDDSFDVVWACESGEHMPDKGRYVQEMARVLKPGGRLVIATWCQRDEGGRPFNVKEKKMLNFLYSEWTHPFFISISDYAKLMFNTGRLKQILTDDWTKPTIPSWRHSIWVGVFDPWPVIRRPLLWYKTLRDGITLERMHQSFADGLMQYGMMTATKV